MARFLTLAVIAVCALLNASPLRARVMGAVYTEAGYANADYFWAWRSSTAAWRGYFHQGFYTGGGSWQKSYIYDYAFRYQGALFSAGSFRVRWLALRAAVEEQGNDLELLLGYPLGESWQVSLVFNPHDVYLEGGDYLGWGLGRKFSRHSLYLESGLSSGVESPDYGLHQPRPTTPIHTVYTKWDFEAPDHAAFSLEMEFNHVFKEYARALSSTSKNVVQQQSNHARFRLGGYLACGNQDKRWLDTFYLANDLDYLSTSLYYHTVAASEMNKQWSNWNQLRVYNHLHLLWASSDLYLRAAGSLTKGWLRQERPDLNPASYLPGLPGADSEAWRYTPGYKKVFDSKLWLGAETSFRYDGALSYAHAALRAERFSSPLHRMIVETGHAAQKIWFFKFTMVISLGKQSSP